MRIRFLWNTSRLVSYNQDIPVRNPFPDAFPHYGLAGSAGSLLPKQSIVAALTKARREHPHHKYRCLQASDCGTSDMGRWSSDALFAEPPHGHRHRRDYPYRQCAYIQYCRCWAPIRRQREPNLLYTVLLNQVRIAKAVLIPATSKPERQSQR